MRGAFFQPTSHIADRSSTTPEPSPSFNYTIKLPKRSGEYTPRQEVVESLLKMKLFELASRHLPSVQVQELSRALILGSRRPQQQEYVAEVVQRKPAVENKWLLRKETFLVSEIKIALSQCFESNFDIISVKDQSCPADLSTELPESGGSVLDGLIMQMLGGLLMCLLGDTSIIGKENTTNLLISLSGDDEIVRISGGKHFTMLRLLEEQYLCMPEFRKKVFENFKKDVVLQDSYITGAVQDFKVVLGRLTLESNSPEEVAGKALKLFVLKNWIAASICIVDSTTGSLIVTSICLDQQQLMGRKPKVICAIHRSETEVRSVIGILSIMDRIRQAPNPGELVLLNKELAGMPTVEGAIDSNQMSSPQSGSNKAASPAVQIISSQANPFDIRHDSQPQISISSSPETNPRNLTSKIQQLAATQEKFNAMVANKPAKPKVDFTFMSPELALQEQEEPALPFIPDEQYGQEASFLLPQKAPPLMKSPTQTRFESQATPLNEIFGAESLTSSNIGFQPILFNLVNIEPMLQYKEARIEYVYVKRQFKKSDQDVLNIINKLKLGYGPGAGQTSYSNLPNQPEIENVFANPPPLQMNSQNMMKIRTSLESVQNAASLEKAIQNQNLDPVIKMARNRRLKLLKLDVAKKLTKLLDVMESNSSKVEIQMDLAKPKKQTIPSRVPNQGLGSMSGIPPIQKISISPSPYIAAPPPGYSQSTATSYLAPSTFQFTTSALQPQGLVSSPSHHNFTQQHQTTQLPQQHFFPSSRTFPSQQQIHPNYPPQA